MEEYSDTAYKMTDKAIKCNHCGNTAAMAIICQGKHVYVVKDEDWTREWQILLCTNCDKVTAIQVSHSSVDEILDYIDGNLTLTRVIDEVFLYPNGDFTIPNPHPAMPEEIAKDYIEAKVVFPFSAKSSAALLRLAVQKLCKHLGEKGKNINNDIKSLVQKGLPSHIQQALDIVRVIGNQSVHPGEINVKDTPEIARKLFELVNEIVDDRISKINRQVEIDKLYRNLPQDKLEEIRKRDGKDSIP